MWSFYVDSLMHVRVIDRKVRISIIEAWTMLYIDRDGTFYLGYAWWNGLEIQHKQNMTKTNETMLSRTSSYSILLLENLLTTEPYRYLHLLNFKISKAF